VGRARLRTDRSEALVAGGGQADQNEFLLENIRLIFRHGMTQLKLYFIGLPGETMDDMHGILELGARARAVMLEELTPKGIIGHVHLGISVLVPKPYTPCQRQPMDDEPSLKERFAVLRKCVGRMPNVSLGSVSIRQAIWQAYISKAGSEAADAIAAAAGGEPLRAVLHRFQHKIAPEVFHPMEGDLRHFMCQGLG